MSFNIKYNPSNNILKEAGNINEVNLKAYFQPVGYTGKKAEREVYKNNLVDYVTKLSRDLNAKTTRLVEHYKGRENESPYLIATKEHDVNPVIAKISKKEAKNMSIRELQTQANYLTRKSRNKTMTVRKTQQFNKKFLKEFGKKYSDLTSEDWAKIHSMMDSGFDSDEAQNVYIIRTLENKQGFIEKSEYDRQQAEEKSTVTKSQYARMNDITKGLLKEQTGMTNKQIKTALRVSPKLK